MHRDCFRWWRQLTTTSAYFAVAPPRFSGPLPGPSFLFHRMPSASSLFTQFQSDQTVQRTCVDTNRYASEFSRETNLLLEGRI